MGFDFVIVGVVVSLLTEGLKRFGLEGKWSTIAVVAVLSVVGAIVFNVFPNAWEAMAAVFASATAFYAVLIKQLMPQEK